MLESLKRQVLNHRASAAVLVDWCTLVENHAALRLIGYLGKLTQKLVRGLTP